MLNKVILQARIMNDIEIKDAGGTRLVQLNLGFQRKVKGEKVNQYINATAFGNTADAIHKFFKKMSPITIEGQLTWDSWDSNGEKKSMNKIIIDNFYFERGELKDQQQPGSAPVSAEDLF